MAEWLEAAVDGGSQAWSRRARASRSPEVIVGVRDHGARERVCVTMADLGLTVAPGATGFHLVERLADAVLDDRSKRPRLIIADATLPGCSGLSVLAGIRSLRWDTPFVILTGMYQAWARNEAWRHGATGLFIEPYDVDELKDFVELVLGGTARA